jgi:hypothetical protein
LRDGYKGIIIVRAVRGDLLKASWWHWEKGALMKLSTEKVSMTVLNAGKLVAPGPAMLS